MKHSDLLKTSMPTSNSAEEYVNEMALLTTLKSKIIGLGGSRAVNLHKEIDNQINNLKAEFIQHFPHLALRYEITGQSNDVDLKSHYDIDNDIIKAIKHDDGTKGVYFDSEGSLFVAYVSEYALPGIKKYLTKFWPSLNFSVRKIPPKDIMVPAIPSMSRAVEYTRRKGLSIEQLKPKHETLVDQVIDEKKKHITLYSTG